ncbi:MAG TPA: TatD family hydrolase [Saprospiraceae bacterium]|nr:TatD family hydrolase [Saprospiraceae bacterium]HMX83536.1 TatD family hydrolase [Saprospiraceae bacterium]HMX86553.1 TatD family hydrolase [Saprospiraceae bacterium]HMZ73370.1 TatD family hydrolase [Saprospiraceae bacterium]HNA41767.1 TatD family hydrolase [Saprospiraceae bacterium]
MIIDTHSHIYSPDFDDDRDEIIQRAKNNNIKKIFLPNIDSSSIEMLYNTEKLYPGMCIAMMGLHPCSVKENYLTELNIVESELSKRSFSAIGEIGLDYYWDKTFINEQKEAFIRQMNLAKNFDIPIVIHSRDSTEDVISLVRQEKSPKLRGIFHCFGGSVEEAQQITDLGFLLGIGGVLTYKKSGLDQTLKHIDLRHIVLETDAPYLTPVPFRGKRNEPSYITFVAEKLAEAKGMSLEEVCRITTENAENLFNPY